MTLIITTPDERYTFDSIAEARDQCDLLAVMGVPFRFDPEDWFEIEDDQESEESDDRDS